MNPAFTLDSTYIHLRPDESALAMEGGAGFWQGIGERHDLEHGRLMGSTDQSRDWDHWERHPAGDEILTLLSGEMIIVGDIDLEQGWYRVELFDHPPGEAHRSTEVRHDHVGALGLSDPGHVETNRGIQRDARYQDVFTLQNSHAPSSQWPMPRPPSTGISAPVM